MKKYKGTRALLATPLGLIKPSFSREVVRTQQVIKNILPSQKRSTPALTRNSSDKYSNQLLSSNARNSQFL